MSDLFNKKPVRQADGEWRYATEPSMLRRKTDWNYRGVGSYAITLVLADRSRDWLGRLVSAPVVSAPEQARPFSPRAFIEPTALGGALTRLWRSLGEMWPSVEPRESQLMPEHFHAILRVTAPQRHPLGQIVGSFKAKATAAARELAKSGASVPPSVLAGDGLFAPGLHDAILWNLRRYRQERDYILANPDRLAAKRANPELFRVVRDLAVALPGLESAPGGSAPEQARANGRGEGPGLASGSGQAGLGLASGSGQAGSGLASGYGQAGSGLVNGSGQAGLGLASGSGRAGPGLTARSGELARPPCGHFMAIGNHFLLQRPLFQIQCSRRFFGYRRETPPGGAKPEIKRDAKGEPIVEFTSDEFVARREAAFSAAADGRVLISPCVSDGERQIAREALAAGLPLVTLQNKGFAKLQKPSGRFFDACAAGQLLMLAPAAWPYQPGHKPMTRFDATAMNRICQWLVGDDAAQINYHGMKVANVDALAREAMGL